MNGQERYLAAIRCEEIDKMPVHWMAIEPAGLLSKEYQQFLDQDPNPELDACFEIGPLGDQTQFNWFNHGTTSVRGIGAGSFPFPTAYYNPETDHFYTKAEAAQLPADKKHFQISWFGDVKQYGYQLGTADARPHKYWWFHKHYFSGPSALERMDEFYTEFGAPWDWEPGVDTPDIRNARALIKAVADAGYPFALRGHAPMHFEAIWGGFGPTTIVSLARKRPGTLKDICRKFEKVSLAVEQVHLEAGLQIIGTGDDLGQKDRALVSPEMYREFFFPALKARCDLAHKYGAVVQMHSCGFVEELVPHFLDAGLDALQSLEVPAGNDLGRIRAVARDRMALVGGIDSSRVMTFGTPADCDAHVWAQMQKATTLDGDAIHGGYIPGPAHELLDTPLANVRAVIHAIKKYGTYPLAFKRQGR